VCAHSKAERVFAQCFKSIYQQEAHKKGRQRKRSGVSEVFAGLQCNCNNTHSVSTDEQMTTASGTISIFISIYTGRII